MEESLMEFPCSFQVKAMGLAGEDFVEHVVALVRAQMASHEPHEVSSRPSSGGKYWSVTVTIEARSRAQIDRIYQSLTDSDLVLYAL
ncbi:MAG: DUF493 domain-containing protein [Candidatus Eremiobacteraeota bacterium]|nr:DUF493 domain-containing protein [Candidatus Eremiobacteraeota bacterium]